jgi:hypothetical protein
MPKKFPRSPYERLLGYVHLPRLIDKARLHREGRLVGYNYKTSGFDKELLAFLQLDADTFEDMANRHTTDEAIADWVQRQGLAHSPEQIEAWNSEMIARQPTSAEQMARFKFTLKELGSENRADVKTYFDLIELDEGRLQK